MAEFRQEMNKVIDQLKKQGEDNEGGVSRQTIKVC